MATIAASQRARILFVVATLAVLFCLSAYWVFGGERLRWPLDFQVFWFSGRRSLPEVYADHGMPFVYPPTALFLFKPFSLISFLPSYLLWIALSAALFGIAVARICGARVAALSFLSPAAIKGITLGQSAMLLGGALFASLRLPPVARGAVFGLVAAIKPQLVVFAPIAFLLRREWTVLAGMAGAWMLAVLASMAAFGPWMWADWLEALPRFHELLVRHNVLSFAISPAARAEYLGLQPLPVLIAAAGIGLAAVIALARRVEGEMLIALVVGASLAAAPYAHTHDSIALIPACIVLLHKGYWPLALAAAFILTGVPVLVPIALVAALIIGIAWAWEQARTARVGQDAGQA